MRRNYSVLNAIAAVAMALCVSFGFQSCGQVDNPMEEVVNTVSEKTGATPEEVSALIQSALSDEAVQQAIASGDPIKINVSSSTSTSSSDQTITIPMNDGLSVELTFTNGVSTSDDNPLEFKAETGADADSGDSANQLTIAMPDITGLVITIELPTTTVTLTTNGTSTVYKSVTAKTATNTLIVENGVTIKELKVEGGTVLVKDGGSIETYVLESSDWDYNFLEVCDQGIYPKNLPEYNCVPELQDSNGDPYFASNLKIVKGKDGIKAGVLFYNDTQYPIDKLTVESGITCQILPQLIAKKVEVIGGGTATFNMVEKAHKDESDIYHIWCGASAPESISNVVFNKPDFYVDEENEDDPGVEVPNGATLQTTIGSINADLENCTFNSECVEFGDWEEGGVTRNVTAKQTTFNGNLISINVPKDRETFKFTFENCTFSTGCVIQLTKVKDPNSDAEFDYSTIEHPLTITLEFASGAVDAIQNLLDLNSLKYFDGITNIDVFVKIGNTTYKVVDDGGLKLEEANS